MQEIQKVRADGTTLRDILVGQQSPELMKEFENRRLSAEQEAAVTGESITIRETRNIGRNDPCPCGSNLKFKKCCGRNLSAKDSRVK